jgi:predicted Zn-dependent protease
MLTVIDGGGVGYASTSDLSEAGLRLAGERALAWARRTAPFAVTRFEPPEERAPRGEYETAVEKPCADVPLAHRFERVQAAAGALACHERIVDWGASLYAVCEETLYLTGDGGRVAQRFDWVLPELYATANRAGETQTRTLGAGAHARQGGLEVLDSAGFDEAAPRVAAQALELLDAPNCPSDRRDLLLAPDQVFLQIHESIGHPLELDRILGDERNYAGTSFVTPDMFGQYRYGSKLLNVSFDPTLPEQLASYAFDDEGKRAEKQYVIREGVLLRGLGGATSQLRSQLPGVANSRASSWNRPPIDRMANLNLEPGDTPFDELVRSVERGVYMQTNRSWSIDDSRNKFQFGCEWGRLIEDGELRGVVRNPNYRGISAEFWRNLRGVGDRDTFQVLGTPTCGKGEPNQAIRVGHAAPACLFADVDVFGGA